MRASRAPALALLAFALAWPSGPGAQDVPATADRLLTAIPGTRLHAAVPAGFSLAGDFPGLRHALTERLFLEGKVDWDYDAEPSGGKKRQDVEYKFGVGYGF